MRGQITPWSAAPIPSAESLGTVNPITADGSSQLTVPHTLGRAPIVGVGSVTAPGYIVGYVGGDATTATFWVRGPGNTPVPGGSFVFTWLLK